MFDNNDSPFGPTIKKNKPKEIKAWHQQQELILKNWGEVSACYRYMHYKSYQKFKAMSMRFTLPIIIISTITGTANFAQDTFPDAWQLYVPLVIGGLNLFSAILTTVLQFLKANELLESHRVSSISYGKLSRDITLELSLPITERNYSGNVMVDKSRSEYDRLIEQSPPIPRDIIKKFDHKFPENKLEMDKKFSRPEILTIGVIKPFDSAKEQQLTHGVANIFKKKLSESKLNSKSPSEKISQVIKSKSDIIQEIENLKKRNLVSNNKPQTPDKEIIVDIKEEDNKQNVDELD